MFLYHISEIFNCSNQHAAWSGTRYICCTRFQLIPWCIWTGIEGSYAPS